jgi:ArsR family transcriptional regulator
MTDSNGCRDKVSSEPPRFGTDKVRLLADQPLEERTKLFKALSDPTRLQMLFLLAQVEDICTCEFQEILDLSQPSVSYHTKVLLDTGLVERRSRGPWSHYSLASDGLSRMLLDLV